jgi:hypothetical protein
MLCKIYAENKSGRGVVGGGEISATFAPKTACRKSTKIREIEIAMSFTFRELQTGLKR